LKRRLALAGLLSALAFAGSCKDSTAPQVISGIYELESVDGEQLPVVVFEDAQGKDEMLNGRVDLYSDGTFYDVTTVRSTINGSATEDDFVAEGTYRLSGTTVTFTSSTIDYSMELSAGGTLTQNWNGLILVYKILPVAAETNR
jgi:hypothetical protein